MKKQNKPSGFTLVELLLYLSITGIILLSISFFLSILLESRIKNQTIAEVEHSGVQAMQVIEQTIRNSGNIINPVVGTESSFCSLSVLDGTRNPTVFDISSNEIRMKEGSADAVGLTSNRLDASNLTFSNLSRNGTNGLVRVQFTLSHKNPGGRNEYNYSKTFYGSASL